MASRFRRFICSLRPITGLRVAEYYTKSTKKTQSSGQAWLLLAGVTTSITGAGIYFLGKPDEPIEGLSTEEPAKYADENFVKAYILRALDTIVDFKKSFSEPSSEKLLPDLLPPPYQRPYTLVLELNDLLIHTGYDRSVGWKYQKRPGVDALLIALFDYYEIVLFTSEVAMTGNSIVEALDPNQLIMYKLFRDATKYIDGKHVKDLNGLNRSLNRVIVVDTDKDAVKFHPENTIILDKWKGDINDRTLWDLISFLQTLAVNGADDTRPVLDYYKREGGEERILETFKAYRAKLQEEEEIQRQFQEERLNTKNRVGKISPFSFQRRKPSDQQSGPPQASTTRTSPDSPDLDSLANDPTSSSSSQQQSWTQWMGSWVGWK